MQNGGFQENIRFAARLLDSKVVRYPRVSDAFLSLCSSIARPKLDKVKAQIYQDEISMRSLDAFIGSKDGNVLFIVNAGSETLTVSQEIPPLDKLKRKGLLVYKSKVRICSFTGVNLDRYGHNRVKYRQCCPVLRAQS